MKKNGTRFTLTQRRGTIDKPNIQSNPTEFIERRIKVATESVLYVYVVAKIVVIGQWAFVAVQTIKCKKHGETQQMTNTRRTKVGRTRRPTSSATR
jgi:hypothetical protein